MNPIYTIKEYLSAPKSRRENKFGFYKEPDGYLFDGFDTPCPFNEYWRKNYPIQFFFRETLHSFFRIHVMYPIEKFYDSILDHLNPQQKWLTKQIPKSWSDKTALIPDLVFACMIDFVESENGIEHRSWEGREDTEKELKDAYRWAKMRKRYERYTWETPYPRCVFHEELYDKMEQKYLQIIIKHHKFLWT